MQRRNREIVIFSLSAIDLFCSGMGAVMVLMMLLLPYYKKQTPVPPTTTPVAVVTPPVPPAPRPEPTTPPKPVPQPSVIIHDLELMIVMDTTGSMKAQIDDLRNTLGTIVNVLSRLSKNLRVGVVAYRDDGDEYVTRGFPLRRVEPDSAGIRELGKFIEAMRADGGGDTPEAVAEAMEAATSSGAGWTPLGSLPERSRQVILVVADAPGHDSGAVKSGEVARSWHAGDPRRGVYSATPLAASGYFKPLVVAGKGRIVALTDMLGAILDVVIDRE